MAHSTQYANTTIPSTTYSPLSQPIPLGDIFLEQQTLMPQTRGHVPICARHLHYTYSSLPTSPPHHHSYSHYINYYPAIALLYVNPRIIHMHHDIVNQNYIHSPTK